MVYATAALALGGVWLVTALGVGLLLGKAIRLRDERG